MMDHGDDILRPQTAKNTSFSVWWFKIAIFKWNAFGYDLFYKTR